MHVQHKIVQIIDAVQIEDKRFIYALDATGNVWRLPLVVNCWGAHHGYWEFVRESPSFDLDLAAAAEHAKSKR